VVPFEPQHPRKLRESINDTSARLWDLIANGVPEIEQVTGNDQGCRRIRRYSLVNKAEEEVLVHIIGPAKMKVRNDYGRAETKLSHE